MGELRRTRDVTASLAILTFNIAAFLGRLESPGHG
jgi:hypothetical protein